jgi:PAS domain-containing protein
MVDAFVAFWRSIGGRLYCVGGLAFLAVVALAAASMYFASLTSLATHKLFDDGLIGIVDAAEIEILVERHRRIIETAPSQGSPSLVTKHGRIAEALYSRIDDLAAASDDTLGHRIASGLPELAQQARRVLLYAENQVTDKASEAVKDYAEAADHLQERIRVYRAERIKVAAGRVSELLHMGRLLMLGVAAAAITTLVLIGPLSFVLIRSIVVRLKGITGAMERLAANDTTVDIEAVKAPDEIGEMARAVDVFKCNAITLLDHKSKLEQMNFWLDVALNNMTRGLSLVDVDQRLVVCNALYQQMYDLPAELVQPGTPFDSILQHRIALIGTVEGESASNGALAESFARILQNRTAQSFSQQMMDGRTIQVSVRPLPDGGWVDGAGQPASFPGGAGGVVPRHRAGPKLLPPVHRPRSLQGR